MFRRFTIFKMTFTLFASVGLLPYLSAASLAEDKPITGENVAELVILITGSREGLTQVRRNGVERGRMTRLTADGRTEELTYERRFIRGESSAKDKVRFDQKSPTVEYALVYDDGRTWGISNGSSFIPRAEATATFVSQKWHDLDALLRYKEDGSTVNMIGKEKQKGIEMYVIDLTDKEQRRTRYYVSVKSGRVLWLEYEETPAGGGKPVKYQKKFYDYRGAQGTLFPYRTVLLEDGKQIQETRVLTVTYGVKMEDSLFQNPETPATASQP